MKTEDLKKEIKVPVVFTFDDNWVEAACVCFVSLALNKEVNREYEFIVVHRGLSQESIDKLQRQVQAFDGVNLVLRFFDDQILQEGTLHQRDYGSQFTIDCFTRLFLPRILPDYEKVIFSDVDVIFQQGVAPLYDQSLNGNYLGGVKDLLSNRYIKEGQKPYFSACEAGEYIYAGLLVMALDDMRNASIEKQFIAEMPKGYKAQDQDIINKVCKGKITFFHQKYTILSKRAEFSSVDEIVNWLGLEEEYKEALSDIVILHYAGADKPWHAKFKCLNDILWWDYYKQSVCFDAATYNAAQKKYKLYTSCGQIVYRLDCFLRPKAIKVRDFLLGLKAKVL